LADIAAGVMGTAATWVASTGSRAGWEVIFSRSCSFAAERPISGLILAIYAISVSSDPRSKDHF
jgi:hypothetical protein